MYVLPPKLKSKPSNSNDDESILVYGVDAAGKQVADHFDAARLQGPLTRAWQVCMDTTLIEEQERPCWLDVVPGKLVEAVVKVADGPHNTRRAEAEDLFLRDGPGQFPVEHVHDVEHVVYEDMVASWSPCRPGAITAFTSIFAAGLSP
ncbi:hypothetical protein PG993_005952 [Apiospora rasikravindrae]|uniref:Uncharacterized protein n=1 Tax=Apiospora rasikravindrae TaxID=990691 RepID=A0ABR1TAV7_9PEZI